MHTKPSSSRWTAQTLREAASAGAGAATGCAACNALRCPGWEALSSTFDETALAQVGTLRETDADAVEPTLDEYHPQRSNYWSEDAPIAVGYHPYNRCDVWACKSCARVFLRYTEYGGYYVESRIRAVAGDLVVDPQ